MKSRQNLTFLENFSTDFRPLLHRDRQYPGIENFCHRPRHQSCVTSVLPWELKHRYAASSSKRNRNTFATVLFLFRSVTPVPRKLDQTILFLSLSHLWLCRRYSVGNKSHLKAMCHTDVLLWSAREIASMVLPAEQETHWERVTHRLKAMCHTDALPRSARKIASMALPAAREAR